MQTFCFVLLGKQGYITDHVSENTLLCITAELIVSKKTSEAKHFGEKTESEFLLKSFTDG